MALKVVSRFKKAGRVAHEQGFILLVAALLAKLDKELHQGNKRRKIKPHFLVKEEDILKARWATEPYRPSNQAKNGPYTINWVMSPPRSGGGHQNIYRFIKFLEDHGHTCHVYLYSANDFATVRELRDGMKDSYPNTKASMEWLDGSMEEADAIFATGWETAYPVFNDPGKAKKFYFVQDFEPYFYPVGTEYILAENTYRFNFHGITAGSWLSTKLNREYGMSCDHYDFGADKALYRFYNNLPRKKVFFYARPVTARRGFELGIMALTLFHNQMPEYDIVLAGWDVAEYHIPFPYTNLKTLSLNKLSDLYNECAIALVISLTNMSLMPLELLAAGVIPILNDGDNNRLVSDNKYIKYAKASPDALASAMVEVLRRKDLPEYAKAASESIAEKGWEEAGSELLRSLEGQLHG